MGLVEPSPSSRGWRSHLPACAGFVALTAGFLWPAIVHFHDRVLSESGDGSVFLWSYWYMPREALAGRNPFTTHLLFHPVGANLAFNTSSPLEAFLVWPITRLLGVGAAVNTLQIAAVLLSAVGAYLLSFRVCGDRRAAFFAGAAFAFLPYRFVHMGGHFNLIHAEFLPFSAIALLRLLESPSRSRGIWLGVVIGLVFLTDFYLTVFVLIELTVIAVVRRRQFRREHLARVGQAAGVAVLVALPLLVVLVGAVRSGELDPIRGWAGADVFSADLLSWFIPPTRHPWWGSSFAGIRNGWPAAGEGTAYPGLVVMGLAIAGAMRRACTARREWATLAAVGALLAMGPFLQIDGRTGTLVSYLGRQFSVPMPYLPIHFVPVLNGVRVPGRFVIVASLGLVVLASLTLAALSRAHPRWAWLIVGGALLVTLMEFLPGHLAQHPVAVPRPYHRIADDPASGAVLEIPLQWQSGTAVIGDTHPARDDTIFLYYATVHGKRMVSGYLSRYPRARMDRLTDVAVYRQVLALGGEPGFADPATFRATDLEELGISYVVYHRDRPWPRAYDYFDHLGLNVLDDDGTVIVWKVGG